MNRVLEICFKCLGFENKPKIKKVADKTAVSSSVYDLAAEDSPRKKERILEIDGIKVLYPYDTSELQEAIIFLKKGQPVIVSTEMMDFSGKCMAYLEGSAEVLGGRVKPMPGSDNLFLILPEGVLIEGEEE